MFFIIPCVDIYEKIDLRTATYEIPPQEVSLYLCMQKKGAPVRDTLKTVVLHKWFATEQGCHYTELSRAELCWDQSGDQLLTRNREKKFSLKRNNKTRDTKMYLLTRPTFYLSFHQTFCLLSNIHCVFCLPQSPTIMATVRAKWWEECRVSCAVIQSDTDIKYLQYLHSTVSSI